MALIINKRANFDYEILAKYEAGMVLFGHEVKSMREGNTSLKGSYLSFKNSKTGGIPEIYLIKASVSLYKKASTVTDYDPERERKLLLKKSEINRLVGKVKEQGLTLVPLKIYTKNSFLKLEFGLARGKKKYDKRASIKKKDLERQERTLKKRIVYR